MSRDGRGWGPFSGGQLTTMVCVIVAAVAFPVAASAVTGSNVFVADATSGRTAKVSASGAVSVGGSVTSKIQGSTTGNKVEATKDNQMLVAEANPSSFYSEYALVPGGGPSQALVIPPVASAVIVKSIRLSAYSTSGIAPWSGVFVSAGADCSTQSRFLGYVDWTAGVNTTTVLPFDPGVPVANGTVLCVNGLGATIDATANGYTVPSATVPAPVARTPVPHKHA